MKNHDFEYESIPVGYYDNIFRIGLEKRRGLQYSWHYLKFFSVKNQFPKYINHLDVACGPGTFIGNFLDNRSIGLDISKNQIIYAKNTYTSLKNNFIQHDIINGSTNLKNFDVITLIEFIEHIKPEEVNYLISNLLKQLNKNGKIIITTPNYSSLWILLEKIISFLGPVDYKSQHINRYSKKRILKELKFQKVSVTKYINFGIFLSIFNTKMGIYANNIISNLFNNFFGYSLLITIENE